MTMKGKKNNAMLSLAAVGLLFSATAAADNWFPDVAPQSSVNACIAEIADHADYSNATRVRHLIKSQERRNVGHTLRINTMVFDGSTEDKLIREYKTKCIVGNSNKPVKFVLREATGDA
jgi:hypothetical protein